MADTPITTAMSRGRGRATQRFGNIYSNPTLFLAEGNSFVPYWLRDGTLMEKKRLAAQKLEDQELRECVEKVLGENFVEGEKRPVPVLPVPDISKMAGAELGVKVDETIGIVYSSEVPSRSASAAVVTATTSQWVPSERGKKSGAKKRNAYMEFVYARKSEEEAKGVKMPKSAPELVGLFGKEWEMMDEDARAPYKAIAAAGKVERDRWDD